VLYAAPHDEPAPTGLDGSELAEMRRAAGVSQSELARRIGVNRTLVVKWEGGRQPVPRSTVGRILEAVAKGASEPVVRPDRSAEVFSALIELVRAQPGTAVRSLPRRLGARKQTVGAAVARARAEGLVHGTRGLFPGQEEPAPPPGKLRLLRRQAGWSQEELGQALGLRGASTVAGWENGRPVPPQRREELWRLLVEVGPQRAAERRAECRRAILETFAQEGFIPPDRLWREKIGRGEFSEAVFWELVDEGALHAEERLEPIVTGHDKTVRGFCLGPAPVGAPLFTGDELRWLRLRAGLGQAKLGELVGESKTQIRHYERGNQAISAPRAQVFREVLSPLPPGEPRQAPGFLSDEELLSQAKAAMLAESGLPARQLVQRFNGEVRRRWAAIALLVDCGWAEERLERYQDSTGRWQRRRVLYPAGGAPPGRTPPPAPGRLSDDELVALAVGVIAATPGLNTGDVVKQLPGDMNRRWWAVRTAGERRLVVSERHVRSLLWYPLST